MEEETRVSKNGILAPTHTDSPIIKNKWNGTDTGDNKNNAYAFDDKRNVDLRPQKIYFYQNANKGYNLCYGSIIVPVKSYQEKCCKKICKNGK